MPAGETNGAPGQETVATVVRPECLNSDLPAIRTSVSSDRPCCVPGDHFVSRPAEQPLVLCDDRVLHKLASRQPCYARG